MFPSKALILGLGKSGRCAAQLLCSKGVEVLAVDENPRLEVGGLLAQGAKICLGPLPDGFWEGAQVAILSPGWPPHSPSCQQATQHGLPLWGEIELAFRCLPKGTGPLLGITGTNGKSTTTALLGHLLSQARSPVFVGGNLGRPLTEACAQVFAAHAVELSSYQLETLHEAAFLGACWLNLTEDHLARYGTMEAYEKAKLHIFERPPPGAYAVLNADEPRLWGHAAALKEKGRALWGFSLEKEKPEGVEGWARRAEGGAELYTPQGKWFFPLNNRSLRGRHNTANAMAALCMAHAYGIPPPALAQGLSTFEGLPHRLEWIRTLDGVEWINDSKATNVDSTLVALQAVDAPLWLIAGGRGKGASYQPLINASRKKVLGVLTVGEDAPLLAEAFAGEVDTLDCGTLREAVLRARHLATPGQVVLLSPACASQDQFENFEERGNLFRQYVEAL
ncbi:MAG: UDP-N-acetylmuramoyl-L-alanine--D-glutamate ligase [Proteobacteria bacterium]|nr:UDP-N-acetylmuramoyl-L-alanine--D-glutamate ligase [Cystobacterineae bacterium]MCL2258735.1 UDP-N-acetylmuramoyl-L-alanine--D-glutamate ligase [Cystobacterineae bacterium]MCL2314283.1 UDP-N-acetylmuramoyl-L-alanine--D-glutamate ligase [Pseudomonadota bacterium]